MSKPKEMILMDMPYSGHLIDQWKESKKYWENQDFDVNDHPLIFCL